MLGSKNEDCQFAAAEMLIEQKFGSKSQSEQTAIIKNMAKAQTGSYYAKPANGPWGATMVQAQSAMLVDSRVAQAGLTTTVKRISYDTLKQIVASGRAVSVNVLYGNLDLYKQSGEASVCNTAIGSNKFVGHQIVVVGFSEIRHTCRYIDPLDLNKTVHDVSIDRFLAATHFLGSSSARTGTDTINALYFN